jgi:flagellar basal body-associated protein FliL
MEPVVRGEAPAFEKVDYSMSMAKANLYTLLIMLPIIIVLGGGYAALWGFEKTAEEFTSLLDAPGSLLVFYGVFIGVLILGTVIHELIHGLTWVLAGRKPWSTVKFGFQWRTFTPYTHLQEPLKAGAYRIGTWMPGFITGFLPAFYGILYGSFWLVLLGGLFILAAGGDFLILWSIRGVDKDALVEDHPTRAGCYVLQPSGGESDAFKA